MGEDRCGQSGPGIILPSQFPGALIISSPFRTSQIDAGASEVYLAVDEQVKGGGLVFTKDSQSHGGNCPSRAVKDAKGHLQP